MTAILGRLYHEPQNNNYVKFKWVVSEKLIISSGEKVVVSPEILVSNDKQSAFQLKLVQKNSLNDIWGLRLCRVNGKSLSCKCTIEVLKNGQIADTRSDNYTFSVNNREKIILDIIGISSWSLSIVCQLKFPSTNTGNNESADMDTELGLKFNFEWIFLNKNFSDLVLQTACGKEIPAHRLVLATASPVFQAMFSHDMLENKSQSVDMVDISHQAAVEMLRYIYTGSVEIQEFSLAADVLAAADKYQLEELKNKCERILGSNLSTENAVEALKIADTYSAKNLEKEAVDFIKRKMNETLPLNEIKDMILGKGRLVSK
ncbi:protein roadkill-like [Trichogramma pretiosum]|uniref:protein roadkill-like n=1 Tax=Trichogramma pretiosum TaxID=7493 RepID=UPI0006C9A721|nr:protein roadkill-like [Trichogramma pretiosum]